MKTILLLSILFLWLISLSGCGNWNKVTWQSSYYDGWVEDSNLVYGPIFTNYEGCKNWAISKAADAYNNYVLCNKNCHDSVDWTPLCEEVVRSRQPLPISKTFENYVE